MTEEKTPKKESPRHKVMIAFMQHVVGPTIVAAVTSYGIYAMQIRPDVKEQASSQANNVIDVREDAKAMVRWYLAEQVAAIASASGEQPTGETTVNQSDDLQIQVLEKTPPPVLVERWAESLQGLDEGDRKLELGYIDKAWTQQVQEQLQEQR